jgi:hypothetical protein
LQSKAVSIGLGLLQGAGPALATTQGLFLGPEPAGDCAIVGTQDDWRQSMWKIVVGFVVFAAVSLFVIMKAGDKVDMSGEKHGADAVHVPEPAPAAPAAAPAAEAPAAPAAPAEAK